MKTIEKKDPYLHILNTQGNVYEEFLPDQVLTHKNLNKVVNYFEDQDRLSRIYLIGVGVGCGMNIVSYSDEEIIIGQGVGITTDGDIIKTETRRFQYYLELTDRADYDLFEGMEVYEIYEQEGAGRLTDELPLTSFNSNVRGTLKDYMLIAYIENYTEDEGLCGGSGCDETGNKVYSNLKFLLTHKDNYTTLISNDTIYKSHDVLSYYDTLPELCMPRLLLTKTNTISGISIHDQFKNAFFLKNELTTGITTIIDRFKHRINFAKFGITIQQITTSLNEIFTVTEEQFIQYKYDLLKDLIDTYREIRELILHTKFECVANVNAFPKHLLLGALDENLRFERRHSFYPSPTVSENDENLMSIRALCIKFFNQLKEYKIPNVSTATIKVTPSKSYEFKLSERSIPYYYQTKNSLITNWNPISIQQRKPQNQLGYHVLKLKNIPCIQEPLKYSHLDKDFYRIEGHLGKDFRLALRKINSLKAKYNLAFDVKAVSIGFPVNKVTLDDDKCDTKDYSILLKTWEQEYCCTAESAMDFFEKYQYNNLGDNDTSTQVYTFATQQQQVLQLLGDAQAKSSNSEETAEKAIITNANSDTVQDRYQTSIRYAMDQAYTFVGNQEVPAGYVSNVALGIIDQILGTNDRDDDYFFYTESAVKIVAGLSEIKRLFLKSLDEIYNTEKWTALNNAIDLLCSDVDQVLFKISEAGDDATFGTRTHDKMYEYFIYDLSKLCCYKERFSWLKEQIDDIRYDIYRELVFSRLIEKHPGAEHMAGVPKGGTFLMVYLGGTEELLEDDSVLRKFNGLVQFDFALPYMCCSDCPPETVVYNLEPETTLTIAKTKYCLPEDEGQVDFITQSSGDGVVTSPQGDAFIVAIDNGYAFDPSEVPDDLLGETLTFLVDGKTPTTPVEICVYRFPTDITPTATNPSWDAAGVTLYLSVNHEDVTTYPYTFTYTWQRANEAEIGTGNDVNGTFEHPETLDDPTFAETITVIIGIEGTPTACTVEAELPISETRPIPEDVDVQEIICYNLIETSPMWVPVTVTPFGAVLTSPQEPLDAPRFIEQNDEGNYFIDPIKVPVELAGEEITFFVNGTLVEGKTTRVAMLPSFINRDEEGNALQPYSVVEWNAEGVLINLRASHQFQSETYIEYRWIDRDDTDIVLGTSRLLDNIQVRGEEDTLTARYRVEMRVIGLVESCTTFFDIDVSVTRPTLDIPAGLCSGESIELTVNPDDVVTTSASNNLIQNISDTVTLETGLLANGEVGQPIDIFLNGTLAATTTIYKVPSSANIRARQEFVEWDGENVIVRLTTSPRVPGVTNPQDYLEVKWFDDAENPIPTEALSRYFVATDGGVVLTNLSVKVCVKSEIGLLNPCESEFIVPIDYTRPTFELERGYCFGEVELNEINIPVSTDVTLTSPQGSGFIIENGSEYTFRPSALFALGLIGQRIGFEIGGVEVAHTTVYKVPTDLNGTVENSSWNDDQLTVNLTSSYTLPGVLNPDNYLKITWQDDNNVDVPTPSNEVITAENGEVNKTYTVSISVDPSLMDTDPCDTVPVPVPINIPQPEPDPVIPPDLGLEDRYCWGEDDPIFTVPLPVNPNDFTLVSPQETATDDFVRPNGANHEFRVSEVPDAALGNLIQFRIGLDVIDTTTVYKLPEINSIGHDRANSQWVSGGYEIVFSHNFDDKDYFNYEVVNENTGETVEEVRPGVFKVEAGSSIDEAYKVTISVNGVSCTSIKTVQVRDTREGDQVTVLDCSMTFGERLSALGYGTMRNDFTRDFQNTPGGFRDDLQREVLIDFSELEGRIAAARNLNAIVATEMQTINRLRGIIDTDFIANVSDQGLLDLLLRLDEMLEILGLELLRCADDNGTENNTTINTFFEASRSRNDIYNDVRTRINIKDSYITNFVSSSSGITSQVSSSFTIQR
ncbi:hypothetical protein [Kordia sp.]|uniref:hypothetical protein n=1 Tax=Kordia sp. TaxID=1965332 RepID=UPI003B5C484E